MLILLPPSEGKAPGGRGAPMDLASMSFPELTTVRTRVLAALATTSGRPDALAVLGAPKGAADQVAANVDLATAPARRVDGLYTGVLYDALDLASLDAGARRRAARSLVVVSAAFGALRPTDRVPAYRLSMDVSLPGVGPLAATWREVLGDVLAAAAGRGAIVDLRSSTYVAAWRPEGSLAERTVAVHVVRDGPGGRTAVSHMAKHTRGLAARHLLASGAAPHGPEDVAAVLADRFDVALEDARPGRIRRLEVVEPG